jgi:hypothetical protein
MPLSDEQKEKARQFFRLNGLPVLLDARMGRWGGGIRHGRGRPWQRAARDRVRADGPVLLPQLRAHHIVRRETHWPVQWLGREHCRERLSETVDKAISPRYMSESVTDKASRGTHAPERFRCCVFTKPPGGYS